MVLRLHATYCESSPEALVHSGRLCFYQPAAASEQDVDKMLARELGSIQNVITNFLLAVEQEHCWGVARSMHPFDMSWWCRKCSDSTLLCPECFFLALPLY